MFGSPPGEPGGGITGIPARRGRHLDLRIDLVGRADRAARPRQAGRSDCRRCSAASTRRRRPGRGWRACRMRASVRIECTRSWRGRRCGRHGGACAAATPAPAALPPAENAVSHEPDLAAAHDAPLQDNSEPSTSPRKLLRSLIQRGRFSDMPYYATCRRPPSNRISEKWPSGGIGRRSISARRRARSAQSAAARTEIPAASRAGARAARSPARKRGAGRSPRRYD